ncbi:MAG: PAS domain S-box protein [Spirochaetales bacterium]|nr:PAS domain S-box protein [Spirochaetales bacterium]
MDIPGSKGRIEYNQPDAGEKLKLIMETTENGIWDWNLVESSIFIDSRFYIMTGYSPGEFSQSILEWERRIHPDDLDKVKASIKQILEKEKETLKEEYRFIRKDGSYIWLQTRGKIIEWNRDLTPVRLVTIHKDITERKTIQMDLFRREENFHSFFNTISNIVIIYSPEGKILYANNTSSKLLEYSIDEFHNMEITDLYPWNLRSEAQFLIGETIKGNRTSFSLPMVHASGSQIQVETKIYKGYWDEKESIYHISRDISEEKRLLNEMVRIKSAVESSGDAVLITDPEGKYLFHNGTMERIFKYSFSEIQTLNPAALYENPKSGAQIYSELIKHGKYASEIDMRTRGGVSLSVHLRANAIYDDKGKVSAFGYTFTDISELKESGLLLKESEERLNLALNSSNRGVWDWNSSDEIFFISPHCYTIAGYPPNGFPNTKEEILKRTHPSDKPIVLDIWKKLKAGDANIIEAIFRFRKKNDSFMWVQLTGKIVESLDKNISRRLVGTFSDLTADKNRSERMTLLNTLQNRLLKPGDIAEKLKEITEMIIPAIDAHFARIWLLKDKDLCRKGCHEFDTVNYHDRCQTAEKCLHLIASSGKYDRLDGTHRRVPVSSTIIGRIFSGEFDNFLTNEITVDPRIQEHQWAAEEKLKSFAGFRLTDPQGNKIGVLALFSKNEIQNEVYDYLESLAALTSQIIQNAWNITALDESKNKALKLAAAADLARRETMEMNEQLSTIRMAVNSSSDGIAISTVEGEFFYINKTFTELFGFNITKLAETPQRLLFETEETFEKILNYTGSGIGWYGQVEMLSRKGRAVPVFLRAVPFKDKNGLTIGLVWNFTDISEQKESEGKIRQYTKMIEDDLAEKMAMLKKARHLQKNFIQTTLPLLTEFSIHAFFLPCENLGGDFFHIIKGIHENKLVIIIGDCTDHGIKSSMDASLLSSLVNQNLDILYTENKTDVFMNRISNEYSKVADEDQFPTMFVAIIDINSRRMYYSNANSQLPSLKRNGKITSLERVGGIHIGYFENPDYERAHFDFQTGDCLLFYSDALIEIEKDDHSRLGTERVNKILSIEADSPEEYFNSIIEKIEQENGSLPLEDDMTLLQIDFMEKTESEYKFHNLEGWKKRKEKIKEKMRSLDFSIEESEQTTIALDEMCINAFIHGNSEDETKNFYLNTSLNYSFAEFTITDEGEGFNPNTVPDPSTCIEEIMARGIEEEFTHGRGIWITKCLMDSIEYNKAGNSVMLLKKKKTPKVRFQ